MPHYTLYISNGDTVQLRNRELTTLNYETRWACLDIASQLPGPVTGRICPDDSPLYPQAHVRPNTDPDSPAAYDYIRNGKHVADIAPPEEPETGYYLILHTDAGEQIPMTADRLSRVGPEAVKRARQYDAPGYVLRQLNRREVGRVEREHGPDGPTYHFRCRREQD